MTKNMNTRKDKGVFITVEGVHGCGKSTIIAMIEKRVKGLGLHCTVTNDQTGTLIGEEIRRINLLSGYPIAPMTETLLFAAAKHQNIIEVIKPKLEANHIVICERFVDAFFAFQGHVRGIPEDLLECIHHAATESIMPDFTILLDMDPLEALSRIEEKARHRIEKEATDYHLSLRQGYLERAEKCPNRVRTYKADLPVAVIFDDIWADLETLFRNKHIRP